METIDSCSLFVNYFTEHVYMNNVNDGNNKNNKNDENNKGINNNKDKDKDDNQKVVVLSPSTEFVKKAKRFQRKLQVSLCLGVKGLHLYTGDV